MILGKGGMDKEMCCGEKFRISQCGLIVNKL